MRSSFEEVGYLISYMVVSSMLESLTFLCNRGRLCKLRAERIYLYYLLCRGAANRSRETDCLKAILGKLSSFWLPPPIFTFPPKSPFDKGGL